MCNLKIKNRELVFNEGRKISNKIGDFAQNEIVFRETDILLEFIKLDEIIEQIQNYKKLIIKNLEQVH